MLLLVIIANSLAVKVLGDAPLQENKQQGSFLSPVRPLPCHSVTMIRELRPTEFLFIAPGNSGDCSFIFEGQEGARLDIKVRNLKSNLPRGNGDPCEDGQVRLYNYKGSGAVNLAQRLCDNEKEVSMLTDSNMAIVASSLIDGSFSVVARSVRQSDLLAETDVDQFLTPPESTTHEWGSTTQSKVTEDAKESEEKEEVDDKETSDDEEDNNNALENEIIIDSEPSAFDNSDGSLDESEEPSSEILPPAAANLDLFLAGSNMTDTNNTNTNKTNCGYDYNGNYICDNSTGGNYTFCGYDNYGNYVCDNNTSIMNNTNHTNHTSYRPPYEYHNAMYIQYEPKPIYAPPYESLSIYAAAKPIYTAPKPEYAAPRPVYTPPYKQPPIYEAPKPVYSAPKPEYAPPKPIYTAPKPIYSAPKPVYAPPKPVYTAPKPIYAPPQPNYGPPKVYKPPHPIYSAPSPVNKSPYDYDAYKPIHEKPFRPSQPIPNNYWEGYQSHSHHYHETPIWYDESRDFAPYPGKPTKHVSLTHDTYPMYPSYFNPSYYSNNTSSTTPPSLTTNSTTKPPAKRTTQNRPKTTEEEIKLTTKRTTAKISSKKTTTHRAEKSSTKPSSTERPIIRQDEILSIPVPWTANITFTSGDNLANSIEREESKTSTTTPRITLNKIIKNLPKLFRQ